VILAMISWAASAQARIVTVGPSLPMKVQESVTLGCTSCVLTNPSAPNHGSDVSPVEGVILRWSLQGGEDAEAFGGNPSYRLRVLAREGERYIGIRSSDPVSPLEFRQTERFSTDLPIKVGQMVGLELENGDSGLQFGFSSAVDSVFLEPAMPDGLFMDPSTAWEDGFIFPFNVEILPPPVILGLTPGDANQVTVEGENFADVTSVKFGATEVAYSVSSESKLIAAAPPGATSAPLIVTTVAGQAEANYTAPTPPVAPMTCMVPKLTGRRLAAAKLMLARDHCSLGQVRKGHHATRHPGRVRIRKQSPPPGSSAAADSAVAVTLGGAR
jgi:IPT/TIG domain